MSLSTDSYQEAKYSTYLNNTSTFRLEELPGFFPNALVFFYPRLQESPPKIDVPFGSGGGISNYWEFLSSFGLPRYL